MNHLKNFCAAVPLLGSLACCAGTEASPAQPVVAASSPAAKVAQIDGDANQPNINVQFWLKRRWQLAYWMKVEAGSPGKHWNLNWVTWQGHAAARNAAELRDPQHLKSGTELEVEPILTPVLVLPATASAPSVHVLLVTFDQAGNVTSPHSAGTPLRGQISELVYTMPVHLSAGSLAKDAQYDIARWFHGFGDASTGWAPTYCDFIEMPGSADPGGKFYKYGRNFKPQPLDETFGCREWAYQLYDDARPYIDVTSYVPKTKRYPHGAYIRNFIGWARFDDRKPVIGKNGDTWLCLHDCPEGEAPGAIPDIKAWATKHGWAVPRPPKRMPMFPDPKPSETMELDE